MRVINLSNYELTPPEINILLKGLKFTPVPSKSNIDELKNDFQNFIRTLKLQYLHARNPFNNDNSLVFNKTNFTPTINNEYINLFNNLILTKISNTHTSPATSNISSNDSRALQSLKNNRDIIIKAADKGSAIVILDRTFYQNACESTLSDENFYKKLTYNPDNIFHREYLNLINQNSPQFTSKESKFLLKFEIKPSNFYALPKIHKSDTITQQCADNQSPYIIINNITNIKIRPIVAGPSNLTHRLSELIQKLLSPFLNKVPSYIKDTKHFLNTLPSQIPPHTILATFDVVNLYTNIDHNYGIQAIQYWLNVFPSLLNSRFSPNFVLDSIHFILHHNNFIFNDTHYLQINGTAMGTKFAPTYANLVMGFLETDLYSKVSIQFSPEISSNVKQFWKRLIDDGFIPWNGTHDELLIFFELLNSLNPSIHFTFNWSLHEIPFLDVLVKKTDEYLSTDIYYKPTDAKLYLPFNSNHPKHVKVNIPYNLALRLRTIISDDDTLSHRLHELRTYLISQNYPSGLISYGFNKALNKNRNELLNSPPRTRNSILPFVTSFNPRNPNIFSYIKRFTHILRYDPTLQHILDNSPFIQCHRQPQNLKKILCTAKFSNNTNSPSVSRCNIINCGLCDIIITGNTAHFENGKVFNIKIPMNCTVKNVIYVMKCDGCDLTYIGETTNLRDRNTLHKSQITHDCYRTQKVSIHIFNCPLNPLNSFKIMPFFKMRTDDTQLRKIKETHFIRIFKPSLNSE